MSLISELFFFSQAESFIASGKFLHETIYGLLNEEKKITIQIINIRNSQKRVQKNIFFIFIVNVIYMLLFKILKKYLEIIQKDLIFLFFLI